MICTQCKSRKTKIFKKICRKCELENRLNKLTIKLNKVLKYKHKYCKHCNNYINFSDGYCLEYEQCSVDVRIRTPSGHTITNDINIINKNNDCKYFKNKYGNIIKDLKEEIERIA